MTSSWVMTYTAAGAVLIEAAVLETEVTSIFMRSSTLRALRSPVDISAARVAATPASTRAAKAREARSEGRSVGRFTPDPQAEDERAIPGAYGSSICPGEGA